MADTGAKCFVSGRPSKSCFPTPAPRPHLSRRSPGRGGQRKPQNLQELATGSSGFEPSPDPPTPRLAPSPSPHLLLLAFEQQERLEGRRGVHPSVAAASKVSAAPPQPPEHLNATSSGSAAATSSGVGRRCQALVKTGSLPLAERRTLRRR